MNFEYDNPNDIEKHICEDIDIYYYNLMRNMHSTYMIYEHRTLYNTHIEFLLEYLDEIKNNVIRVNTLTYDYKYINSEQFIERIKLNKDFIECNLFIAKSNLKTLLEKMQMHDDTYYLYKTYHMYCLPILSMIDRLKNFLLTFGEK